MSVQLDCKIDGDYVKAVVTNTSGKYSEGRAMCEWQLADGSKQVIETSYGVDKHATKEIGSVKPTSKPTKLLNQTLTPKP